MSHVVRPNLLRFCIGALSAALLVAAAVALWAPSAARATATFATQTGKNCSYCHVTPGGPLTAEGQAFHDAGDTLPSTTTIAPGSTSSSGSGAGGTAATTNLGGGAGGVTTTTSPGASAAPDRTGPMLALPDWLHDLLIWAHLIAMTTWLGAIIFVHLVQTPHVAGQGIPRRYLRLAWPSIGTLGLSGTLLTLNLIPSIESLTENRWGLLLMAKIAVFLALVTVAAFATLVVSPRLKRLAEGVAPGPAHDAHRAAGRVTVGYQGRIYDVTSSRLWRSGRHARLHDAWLDQTAALGGAPHGPEVLDAFTELSGDPPRKPRALRAFVIMAYANLSLVLGALLIVAVW
ncbi:MAG: CopD family protein [Thermoleophilia bacterium]